MSDYGVTDKGFNLKRMDTIMEEVHADLTKGFGFDTRLAETSFLKVLVTSFCGQIADLWEVAQDDYYAKYPSTATGINLDNAVQFGGIRRKASSQSLYPLHCTGDDGTVVRSNVVVATNTSPEIRLYSPNEFTIARESCNEISIKVATVNVNEVYTITINGTNYSYVSTEAVEHNILEGLKESITDIDYTLDIVTDVSGELLVIKDTDIGRNNVIALTSNLTTSNVTSVANFYTEQYGKITIPNNIVTKMINNVAGFTSVKNIIEPIYGRLEETDIELRQSYIARSALMSNTMLNSIEAELLNNVSGVETATGYENDSDTVDERGLPPHSIELIVEGGDANSIANSILRKKAGGIQTYGAVKVNVATNYGDVVPIRFSRPEYLYTWIKVVLHGDFAKMPANYVSLTIESVLEDTSNMNTGKSLLSQLLNEGIYSKVSGITYIDIYTASSTDKDYVPTDEEYKQANIIASSRQKVLVDSSRIEVSIYDS